MPVKDKDCLLFCPLAWKTSFWGHYRLLTPFELISYVVEASSHGNEGVFPRKLVKEKIRIIAKKIDLDCIARLPIPDFIYHCRKCKDESLAGPKQGRTEAH